ncbi:MAG TPA: thermonuclease family protein [Xanthobacteraceae bacterium]|nr:thermonuclease family protein [Xanthobacteraceae bacterium]
MRYFLAILLLLCTPAAAAPIEGRAQVIDGDTIAVEGAEARIRLDAIDAPESSQPCFDEAGKRYLCGARAAEALAEMIGRNGRVSCTPKERDKYGRIVAVCRTGTIELNREMIRRGWAVEYTKYSDGRYAKDEAEAMAGRRGLWAGSFDLPWEWRKQRRGGNEPAARLGFAGAALAAAAKAEATTTATSCKSARTCRMP